ncbi:hypothetical protein [Flavobacterium sp. FlaQc-48]|uniref:hypothetical protein n=1 Tax=Flavobacterium sp. FlaQc-48 TaxID=3374181 RepID=UPI003756A6F6
MDKVVKLKIKKEIGNQKELSVIKLKGQLISKGYTEIIHFVEEDEQFYINAFTLASATRDVVHNFILDFITQENLDDTIVLYSNKMTK